MAKTVWENVFGSVSLFMLWKVVIAFNVDTRFPVIYNGMPGSYFGFTVALHRNSEGPVALVGAPRANSIVLLDDIHQPGALFKCEIPGDTLKATCSEVTLDTKGNNLTIAGSDEFSYHDKKDGMWLGVSLDIQQDNSQNDIVTCGHLWKNQFYRAHYLVNGVCYVINSDLDAKSVRKLVPLIDRSKQAIFPPGVYYYAMGQAGMSAIYSENGKHLLLGAPGMRDWAGSIINYPADSSFPNARYKTPAVPNTPTGISAYSYLGYSTTSGRFFNTYEVLYAVGAPRDSDTYGSVYIFKGLDNKTQELSVHQKKEGTQFGEYFGSSVLGVNLNGDSYTDLLVGAPFYSSESGGDEGKVYVYLSNGVSLVTYAELLGGKKPNARFGTSIANAGDLNQDGFNDVAIGAPYEDRKGAVYIYHGSAVGINMQYVQKIGALKISPKLSGFGIHISRGLDIDSNEYPDLLVGAYTSANAVLFRTRPVIHLTPKLMFTPKDINPLLNNCEFRGEKAYCINVTACLLYSGRNVPLSLNFENEIHIEHPSQNNSLNARGFFLHYGGQASIIRQHTTLDITNDKCITHLLYIDPNIEDRISPIQIQFRYRLLEVFIARQIFDNSYPVIDPSSPTNISSSIPFRDDCGTEGACHSNLVVRAKLLGNAESGDLILGEMSSVSLAISVINKGESAYLSELLIYLPPEMPVINQDICESLNTYSNASVVCNLGNPLLYGQEVNILIKLDSTKIPNDRKELEIILEAITLSTDTSPGDNTLIIPLHVRTVADIGITGIPSHDKIRYEHGEEVNFPFPISHTYTVRNHGPSPLQMIDAVLHVPVAFLNSGGRVPFLTLKSFEADSGKQLTIPANYNDTYINLKIIMPEIKRERQAFEGNEFLAGGKGNEPRDDVSSRRTELAKDSEGNLDIQHAKERAGKNMMGTTIARKTFIINCDNEDIECVAIKCSASPFSDIRKEVKIRVVFEIDLPTLSNYLGRWYRLEFITMGRVTMRDTNIQERNEHSDITEVETVFVHKAPPSFEQPLL